MEFLVEDATKPDNPVLFAVLRPLPWLAIATAYCLNATLGGLEFLVEDATKPDNWAIRRLMGRLLKYSANSVWAPYPLTITFTFLAVTAGMLFVVVALFLLLFPPPRHDCSPSDLSTLLWRHAFPACLAAFGTALLAPFSSQSDRVGIFLARHRAADSSKREASAW